MPVYGGLRTYVSVNRCSVNAVTALVLAAAVWRQSTVFKRLPNRDQVRADQRGTYSNHMECYI
jgi:hypothetical protein